MYSDQIKKEQIASSLKKKIEMYSCLLEKTTNIRSKRILLGFYHDCHYCYDQDSEWRIDGDST